jgi:putative Mg2+ transporter-C (MgtC) family protein
MIDYLVLMDEQVRLWAEGLGWPLEAMLRLVFALVAGGLVGLEREVRGRQAGFRTNVLVCLGSAIVMIVSIHFAKAPWTPQAGININVDPARIAYGVMTGIGFLGAGTIVHNKGSVRGLTTAAGMWCVAAIGLAVGFGMYMVALFATVLVVIVLWVLDILEGALPRMRYRTVTIRRQWTAGCIGQTVARFKKAGLHVADLSFDRRDDIKFVDINVLVAFSNKKQYYSFERELDGDPEYQVVSAQEI